jgi:hypothetical protein
MNYTKKSFIEQVMGVKCGFRIPGILRKVGALAPPRKKIRKKNLRARVFSFAHLIIFM